MIRVFLCKVFYSCSKYHHYVGVARLSFQMPDWEPDLFDKIMAKVEEQVYINKDLNICLYVYLYHSPFAVAP